MEGYNINSAVIFAVMLAVNAAMIVVLAVMLHTMRKLRKTDGDKDPAIPAVSVSSAPASFQGDMSLIAVISAAVAACIGSEKPVVIRSVRPVQRQASAWAQAGRRENMF